MKTTTCDICKKKIGENNLPYVTRKGIKGHLMLGSFTFIVEVESFEFNCSDIDICEACVHAAVVDALDK